MVELCRRLLITPGADAATLLPTLFRAQLKLADYDRAAQTLERLAQTSPPHTAADLDDLRGDLSLAANHPVEEAVEHWRAALAAHPANSEAILGKIADAYDADEDWSEAADALRAFLKAHPGHAARQARLAVCLLNDGEPEAADREMLAAVRLDAADDTVKATAPVFDRLRPQLAALRVLDARLNAFPATRANPAPDFRAGANTPEAAHLDRALILYRAGAYPAALADVEAVAEETPAHSVMALLLQAQCLWTLNSDEEAAALRVAKIADAAWFDDRARCDRLRAADTPVPPDPAGVSARQHAARSAILLEADQPVLALEEAEAAARPSEKTGPGNVEAQIVLAAALLRNDRATDALAAAKRATELDPRNADAWALRGRLEQESLADFPAAVDSLTRALAIRKEPRWLGRREVCLRTMGRLAEADRDARLATPAAKAN